MSRNIVICLDGTANEPERSASNVLRTFAIADKDDNQIVYYDPGVGTLGDRGRSSRAGKMMSRVGGLAMGHGVDDKIQDAYKFLMQTYNAGDQIYLFGFSRGAYTARALAGLLRCVGLIQPGLENMVPYAMKLYTRRATTEPNTPEYKRYWSKFTDLHRDFANPDFPHPFSTSGDQLHFMGLWDTVKFVGWFNLKGQFQQARWPFTRKLTNVKTVRHALALDERRRYYAAYRLDADQLADPNRDVQEMWFAGAHSDVGGGLTDPQPLADLSLAWMLDEAQLAGLRISPKAYRRNLGVKPDALHTPSLDGIGVHANRRIWWFAGAGWRVRKPAPNDLVHESVARLRKG